MVDYPQEVLVTGGAGFIGSHVAAALLDRGARVCVVDNLHPFYDPEIKRQNLEVLRQHGPVDYREADIRDREAMGALFSEKHFDGVIHLAAMAGVRPSIENPGLYVSVNLDGSCVLLDQAVRHGKPRFVFASSSSVYGNNKKTPFHENDPVDHPISPYAATKKAGEVLAHSYSHLHDLSVTLLRFFTVYGPGQRPEMAIHKFTRLIDRGDPVPFFGDGSSRRDYTHVTDIVSGVLAALERCDGYHIYNLGESETTSLARMVELIEEAVGKKARLERLPMQSGDVNETFADLSLARAELGYRPRIKVEEGIPGFVQWYRETQG